jgi:hypothetical protein
VRVVDPVEPAKHKLTRCDVLSLLAPMHGTWTMSCAVVDQSGVAGDQSVPEPLTLAGDD